MSKSGLCTRLADRAAVSRKTASSVVTVAIAGFVAVSTTPSFKAGKTLRDRVSAKT